MNDRVSRTVEAMEKVLQKWKSPISEGKTGIKEMTLMEFTELVTTELKNASPVEPWCNPKLMGGYLRKYFNIETERRGHSNTSYLIY